MNRLWVRIALGFALVALAGILTVAFLVNRETATQVRSFVVQEQIASSGLPDRLSTYYTQHGSWAGVESILQPTQPAATPAATATPATATSDQHPGAGGRFGNGSAGGAHSGSGNGAGSGRNGPALTLTDSSGQVIYSESAHETETRVTPQALTDALPITANGKTVGYLIVTTPGTTTLTVPATNFVAQINQSLITAGLVALGLALLLGLLIARGFVAPLRHLATASQRIANGALDQRVPVKGPEEIRHLARTFNEMAASLHESERQRQSMVADIAHELRTPLSVIQGNLRALLDDVYPLEKREIATIYDETLMLGRLVTDLHSLALAESGHLNLDLQPTSIETVVRKSAALFSELAAEKGIALDVAVQRELPPVLIDSDRTMQILHNLLMNSLRHTPQGGRIAITVAPEESTHKPVLRITVKDTGPGISAEDLPHVFERFWRSERSRSREHGGSGLGLAIASALTREQGGEIGVASVPGEGSAFWFTVPVVRAVSPSVERGQRAPACASDING